MKFTHLPGATPVDGFTIRRGIHRGGFGEVYYAVSDAGKEVALKLLQHEQDVELRGVTQCLNLKHPNLINLFDVRTDSHGESWVVMEYVSGTSLEDVLAAFPNGLPLDEVRDWLAGLVAGVSHLHDRGIVHRDLKPANVYRENGVVKVGDVGLSKKLGSDRRGAHTQSVGTVYYMAPEVAKGQYGPEVDVYSLGIMVFELLTGRVPFHGESTAEVLMKHLTTKPDLSPLPEKLRHVVAHALEKDPLKRTRTVRQLEEEFRHALSAESVAATVLPLSPRRAGSVRGADQPEDRNGHAAPFVANSTLDAAANSSAPLPKSMLKMASREGEAPAEPNAVREHGSAGASPSRNESFRIGSNLPRPNEGTGRGEETSRRAGNRKTSTTSASDFRRWMAMSIVVVGGLIIFSPGTPRAWVGLGMVGLAYVVALFSRPPRWSPDELESISEPFTPLKQVLAEPVDSTRGRTRAISHLPFGSLLSRESLRETSFSLTMASLCACLLSVGSFLAEEFLHRRPTPPSVEMMALFMAIVMAGAWVLVLVNQCVKRTSWGDSHPRLVHLLAGVLVGTMAFGLDEFLRVDYQRTGFSSSVFQSLGVHPLTVGRLNPTWLGYSVFFGGLYFFRRWSLDAALQRPNRMSLGRLFSAGMTAFLMTVFFEFPATHAMIWAVTLSATVQLASPWSPPRRRDSFWRS